MKRLILIGLLIVSPQAFSQALSLAEVVHAVKETNPRIRESQWEATAARHRIHADSWLKDPQFGVMFEEVPTNNKSLGNAEMTTYSVSQEIIFPSKIATKAKSLSHEYQAKNALAVGSERERIFTAKKTFFELVATRNALVDKNQILSYYQQNLVSATTAYESNASNSPPQDMMQPTTRFWASTPLEDVLMVKMQKAELVAEIHDLNHKIQALGASLNLLMGRDPEAALGKLQSPAIKTLKYGVKQLEEKLLRQNTDISATEWMAKKSEKDLSLSRQNLIPNLTPEFEYNQRQNQRNAYSVGLSVNVPLWASRNNSEIKAAKAESLRAKALSESQKLVAKEDLYNLYYHAKRHLQILNTYRNEVLPLGRSLVDAALTAQSANKTNAGLTLQKLVNYHQANTMYWEMWKDYQTEYALLERLIGEDL